MYKIWVEPVIEERFDPDRTLLTLEFIEKQAKKTSEENKRRKQAKKTSEENRRKERQYSLDVRRIYHCMDNDRRVFTRILSSLINVRELFWT